MAVLISIDTSTTVCSVAIHDDGQLMAVQSLHIGQSHSSLLSSVIDTLLSNSNTQLGDVKGIILSKGPGSYTGLRIGTSTAKGLCYALDIPLLSVNTLEAMAHQLIGLVPKEYLLCPMLDARRMEVYTTLVDTQMNIINSTQSKIIDQESFNDVLEKYKVAFFGNGALKCKPFINHQNANFIDNIFTSAVSVGHLGFLKYTNNEFENLAYFEPFYLKEFRATKPKIVI